MRAARTDNTHAAIRDGLREDGHTVFDAHCAGHGFPDLVVLTRITRTTLLIEVKTPGGEMTPDEIEFWLTWRGCKGGVAYSLAQARAIVEMYDQEKS